MFWLASYCCNVMTGINYDKLTEEQALDILKEECKTTDVENLEHQIISAPDVLYYKDAYGNLEDAILLQKWDKSLPDRVYRGLLDSGIDIYEAVNVHDLDKVRCPMCDCDMWEFEIPIGDYTNTEWISEYGDIAQHPTFVSNIDGWIWNTNENEKDAPVLCASCDYSKHRGFQNKYALESGYVIYMGEKNEICSFSACDNLIRWDFEKFYNSCNIHIDNISSKFVELAEAIGKDNISQWLHQYNYRRIRLEEIKQSTELVKSPIHKCSIERVYDGIINDLSVEKDNIEDIDYTYILDTNTRIRAQFLVKESNKQDLKQRIIEKIKRRGPHLDNTN
jgi:hypothetical protein